MSDEEFDDLPSITVVASVSRESSWSMPSACELASEREREQRNEDELLALRQQTAAAALPAPRSDSSGSESEVALAAAVTALRVQVPEARLPKAQSAAIALLRKLMPADPDKIEQDYLEALQGPKKRLHQLTEKIVVAVSSAADPSTWNPAARMPTARILCAAVLAQTGLRARRALHHILEGCTDTELEELAKGGGIMLADMVQSGAPGGEKLAAMILKRELTSLADGAPDESDVVLTGEDMAALLSRCSGLSPDKHLLAVQLVGRSLAHAAIHEAPLPALPRNRSLNPDVLKLSLAMARLHLLFRGDGPLSKLK